QTLFDADHNLTQRTDGRGQVSSYVRAADDSRLTDITYTGNSSQNVHLVYDSYRRGVHKTDAVGAYDYIFDDNNAITSVTTTYSGLPAQTITYSYYTDGRRASMSTPAGAYSYTYNAGGLLTAISCPWSGGTYVYEYDAADRLTHAGHSKADVYYTLNAV